MPTSKTHRKRDSPEYFSLQGWTIFIDAYRPTLWLTHCLPAECRLQCYSSTYVVVST